MSEPFSKPDSADELIEQVFDRCREAEDPVLVLDEFCAEHPQLAGTLRGMVKLDGALRTSTTTGQEPPVTLPDFRMIREIGRGGMGVVWEAEQLSLKRHVAIKLHRGKMSPLALNRFQREQEILGRLHQTHIVPIHTAGEHEGWRYFVMALIRGVPLHQVVFTTLQQVRTLPLHSPPSLEQVVSELVTNPAVLVRAGSTLDQVAPPTPASGAQIAIGSEANAQVSTRLKLPAEYFQSVARVMADVAEALHHAHGEAILHRDIKPSNLMVDTDGACWIIDFGLAGFLNGEDGKAASEDLPSMPPEPMSISGIMGTPNYMAPEQFHGKADVRSDVWGLGATLYELLTLRRAFEGSSQPDIAVKIANVEPRPIQELVANVPPDLRAICLKALRKNVEGRYPTAKSFAEDLRRWLAGEPTLARPAWAGRRLSMWARRNKSWAAAVCLGFLGLIAAAGAGGQALERSNEAKRQSLIQQVQHLRLTDRKAGWFRTGWELTRAAAKIRDDEMVRSQAVSLLMGTDVRTIKQIHDEKAGFGCVTMDTKGRVLMAGATLNPDARPQTKLWDNSTGELESFGELGDSPVAFAPDGRPLQLVLETMVDPQDKSKKKPVAISVLDLRTKKQAARFPLPTEKPLEPGPAWSLASNGSAVAAALRFADKTGLVVIWDALTQKEQYRFEDTPQDIEFSPAGDGMPEMLGATYADGLIVVRAVKDGKVLSTLKSDQHDILCMAFGRDAFRALRKRSDADGWLLATGDKGGTLLIWDLATGLVRSRCHGSHDSIHALAFSPDGVTLASAGRICPELWEVATGKFLLDLPPRNHMGGIAFSPDGSRLAVTSLASFGRGGLDVHQVEDARGIGTLRGMTAVVARVCFSRDGAHVASLHNNWRVGVWHTPTNRLLHVFEVPPGDFSDNAAIAFNPDGSLLAFSALGRAVVWNVKTGRREKEWELPFGFCDQLIFAANDTLYSFRVETNDPTVRPYGSDAKKYPRRCVIRQLFGPKPLDPILLDDSFDRHVLSAGCSYWKTFFVAEGIGFSPERPRRVKVWDAATCNEVWAYDQPRRGHGTPLALDPHGRWLAFPTTDEGDSVLVEMPSGRLLRSMPGYMNPASSDLKYQWLSSDSSLLGSALVRGFTREVLFRVGIDRDNRGVQFDSQGRRFALCRIDGTINVVDVEAVRERLAELGLGW